MRNAELREFAEFLIREVRDVAIRAEDSALAPQFERSDRSKRWRKAGVTRKMLEVVVPEAVDSAIFCLLKAIDNGDLRLKFVSKSGREVDLYEEGMSELAMSFAGHEWSERFSDERFFDYCADLKPKNH